jgi:hypothetical protein
MSFPRNTDVAKHLSRKHKRVVRVRRVIIPIDQVPDTDVQITTNKTSPKSSMQTNTA